MECFQCKTTDIESILVDVRVNDSQLGIQNGYAKHAVAQFIQFFVAMYSYGFVLVH